MAHVGSWPRSCAAAMPKKAKLAMAAALMLLVARWCSKEVSGRIVWSRQLRRRRRWVEWPESASETFGISRAAFRSSAAAWRWSFIRTATPGARCSPLVRGGLPQASNLLTARLLGTGGIPLAPPSRPFLTPSVQGGQDTAEEWIPGPSPLSIEVVTSGAKLGPIWPWHTTTICRSSADKIAPGPRRQ